MLRNYLTIAIRNLYRHPFYAGLNILGLAIGLASCLLILLYVIDELSYDRFHERADEIYRLNWDYNYNDTEGVGAGTPPPLAAALIKEIPEIKTVTRVYPVSDMVVRYADKFFNETQIFGVDSTFFDFFSFTLLEGNPATALSEPGSVILTEETARKYFGQTPALGKVIRIGEDQEFLGRPYSSAFKVTGIVADPPAHSHFDFDVLTSMTSHPQVAFFDWSWIWMQMATYAIVDEKAPLKELEAKITDLVALHAPASFDRVGFSYDELISGGGRWNFVFQPLTDLYLGSQHIGNRVGPVGSLTNLYIFSVVALFILLIACINFMNLATARATSRAKEVGVRKVLGSVRRNLVGQFMTEAMLQSVLAMLIAVGLAAALLVPFRQISAKPLDLNLLQTAWLPAALVLLTLIVGFLAGSYPSLYFSAFKPIEVLKGSIISGRSGQRFRNGLVVLQFAISIALISCTLLVHNQMRFFRQTDVGFDKENVLVISNENDRLNNQAASFKEILQSRPQIVNAALTTGVPPVYGFQDYYKFAFLDENLHAQYAAEQRLETLFVIFAGLAILIACLGLLGLAAFMAEKRTKEIGVRKTLGASVSSVLVLLIKDFTRWVLLANLIAWPVAWWGMNSWLQSFAYRIEISWRIFLMAGLIALLIALLTVSYQAMKAAMANPADSLRYE